MLPTPEEINVNFLQAVVAHALAAYLLYQTYVRGSMRRRRRHGAEMLPQLRRYWHTIRWQWGCVALVVFVLPLQSMMYVTRPGTIEPQRLRGLVFIVVANVLLVMYGPIVLAWRSLALRRCVLAPFASVRGVLPVTAQERVLWIGLSLTTGVCEELLFRGFAIQYLMQGPLGLSLLMSTIVSTVLFGVGHSYQGRRGMIQTMLFGLAMSALLTVTGSLVMPMFVHTLVNLRIALLPPLKPQPVVAMRQRR